MYWKIFTDFSPAFKINGKEGHSSRETWLSVQNEYFLKPIIAILSSDYFWYWYTVTSNCRDLNPFDLSYFPLPQGCLNDTKIIDLGEKYLKDIQFNSIKAIRNQKQTGTTEYQLFTISKSKPIIELIDRELVKYYGFTDEELDFIINYDIKYRMGAELEEEE